MSIPQKLKSLRTNFATISLLLSTLILTSFLVLLCLYNQPIADDYRYFFFINEHPSVLDFLSYFYVHENGRIVQHFAVFIFYTFFGTNSVIVFPIFALLFLCACIFRLLGSLKNFFLISKSQRLLLSLLLADFIIMVQASVFDVFLWTTSSSVYLLSIAMFFLLLSLMLRDSQFLNLKNVAALLLVCFLAQLISEPISICCIIVCVSWLIVQGVKQGINKSLLLPLLTVLTSVTGFLILLLSPGTSDRIANVEQTLPLYYSLKIYPQMIIDLFSYRLGLFIATAVFIATALKPKRLSPKWLIVFGIISILVLPLIAPAIGFAGAGGVPYRLRSLSYISFFLGVCGISAALLYMLWKKHIDKFSLVLHSISIVVLIFVVLDQWSLVVAQQARQAAVNTRTISVQAQLKRQPKVLFVQPAPVMHDRAEAMDFIFSQKQRTSYFVKSFRLYFNVPKSTTLYYLEPTDEYCNAATRFRPKCGE